jgi:hypothetical protein
VQPKFAGEIVNACTALHNIASKDDFEYNGGGQDVNETIPAADTLEDSKGQEKLAELLMHFA